MGFIEFIIVGSRLSTCLDSMLRACGALLPNGLKSEKIMTMCCNGSTSSTDTSTKPRHSLTLTFDAAFGLSHADRPGTSSKPRSNHFPHTAGATVRPLHSKSRSQP